MPELPEVNKAKNLLQKHCAGKKIVSVNVVEDEIVFARVPASTVESALQNKTILTANRHGVSCSLDQLHVCGGTVSLDQGPHPIFHFGMTGSFHVRGEDRMVYKRASAKADDQEQWPPRFTKVSFALDDGTEVAFTNARRLGRVKLAQDPKNEAPLNAQGFDAHDELPEHSIFFEVIQRRSPPIKALLLDQSVLAGVGNWIADEVLYQAKIHPGQPSNTLLQEELVALHAALRSVIGHAVKVDADHKQFPEDWLFHYRWGKGKGPATTFAKEKIEFVTVGGRTSAVVGAVQKLHKRTAAVLPPKPKTTKLKSEALATGVRQPKSNKRKGHITEVPAEHSEPAKKKAKGAVKLEAEVKAEQTPKEGTAKVAKSRTAAIAKAVPEVLVAKPVKKSEGRRSKSKASEDGEAAASSATAQNSGQGRGTRRSVRNIAIT